jgi:hypothetical protein
MARKAILIITFTLILFFSLIFTIPILILSEGFSDYAMIDKKYSFYHTPSNISSFEGLNINIDKANIEITYVDIEEPYCVKVEANIKLEGSDLAGKSPPDFFNLTWLNSSEIIEFSLEQLSNSWFNTSTILTKTITIIVSVRKDIALDFNATVGEGTIEMTVPYGVSINNVYLNINSIGDLNSNFYHCSVQGNILGEVNQGNVNLDFQNIKYAPNCSILFTLGSGELDMNILQEVNLGVNISGTVAINDGDVTFRYEDNSDNLGAIFEIPRIGDLNPRIPCFGIYGGCPIVGFDADENNYIFTSNDLVTRTCRFYYNLTFELGDGIFSPHLTSL